MPLQNTHNLAVQPFRILVLRRIQASGNLGLQPTFTAMMKPPSCPDCLWRESHWLGCQSCPPCTCAKCLLIVQIKLDLQNMTPDQQKTTFGARRCQQKTTFGARRCMQHFAADRCNRDDREQHATWTLLLTCFAELLLYCQKK